ncbi:MAG: HAMP domain-containing sensor histidine kinase [Solirubrobacterales bacterium]
MAIGQSQARARRAVGVRLYLALAFGAVALITAGLSVLLVSDASEDTANAQAEEITVGRSVRLADRVGDRPPQAATTLLADITDPGYAAWIFDRRGELLTPELARGISLSDVPAYERAVRLAQRGSRTVAALPNEVTRIATPVFREGRPAGAVLARAERPEELQAAVDDIRGDRVTAALVALGVAALVGFVIASAISSRVKRLAQSAERMTEGRLDEPLEGTGGRDEITALGTALETMRGALRETFGALSSERDRLSAIFDALDHAVIVVGPEGEARFANAAAEEMIDHDGRVTAALLPWLRRADARGAVENDALRVGDRVYAVGARKLPAEGAVLAVVRDRTEELRREIAEREFVSNAAHELRNPIAGISGAIEVLRGGAKDDPEAREHFLDRLAQDTDRVTRLTESLLTLARMEAVSEGGSGALDVGIAMEEAAQAVSAPDGIELEVDAEAELVAHGDSVLLRQVLIGLLTNAFKNTPPPGAVTLRARRAEPGDEEILIEVNDTGSGIEPDEVGRVFERFYRGSGALEQEGFGLGLSIAKRMVDVMGGEIGVRSELGVGSTFWVRLPAARPAPTPVA